MAVLGRLLISSAERLDLPDLLSIDSYAAGDWKFFLKGLVGNEKPYILKGFDIIDPQNAIGTQSCSIRVADSIVFYPTSNSGSFYHGLEEGNSNALPLVPELRKNAVNYVYLTFSTFNTSVDSRSFWDPDKDGGVGGEFTQDVNTESVLIVNVGVSTGSFPTNTIPVAKVTVGPVVITAIQDARDMMFRLGSGGISPDPFSTYSFRSLPAPGYEREEPLTTMTSSSDPNPFQGADKNIYSLKEWMDVVMTKLLELGGTTYWYEDISATSLVNIFTDALATTLKSKGQWLHSSATPGLLTWSEDLQLKLINSPKDTIIRAGNKTLTNEQVMYIDLVRKQPFNNAAQPVAWTNAQPYINTIGGAIGLFANLSKGDWVKREGDADNRQLRVEEFYDSINMGGATTTAALAKSVRLNDVYAGPTANEKGIYDKGVYLASDVLVADRDSSALATAGGNLHWLALRSDTIQNISNIDSFELTGTIVSADGTSAEVDSTAHGMQDGDYITVTAPVAQAGTYVIEVEDADTFYFNTADTTTGALTSYYAIATTTTRDNGYGLQLESANHGFTSGDTIIIDGTTNYDGSVLINKRNSTDFQFAFGSDEASENSGTATLAKIQVRVEEGLTKIIQGESVDIGDLDTENLRQYIGMQSTSQTHPVYLVPNDYNALNGKSNFNSLATDNLTERVSKLTAMMADKAQDKTIRILPQDVDLVDNTTNGSDQDIQFTSFSATPILNVATPGSNGGVTITLSGTLTLAANEVAYFTIDRNNPTVIADVSGLTIGNLTTMAVEENTFIVAFRLSGTAIWLWDGTYCPAGTTSLNGGSGSGVIATLYDPVTTNLATITGVPVVIDNVSVLDKDTVLFSNLASGNNRIYRATVVAGNVTAWAAVGSFQQGLDPSASETVRFRKGDGFKQQLAVFDGTTWSVNDVVRYFSGTDYWEMSSLKTATLLDNTTDNVFTVVLSGSENWIIDYSLIRGTAKETGTIHMTSDGTDVSVTTTGSYIGMSGVHFTGDIDSGNIRLRYTADPSGDDATMKFYTKRWSNAPGGPAGPINYTGGGGGGGGAAAGSAGDIQYNSAGVLAGNSNFKIDTVNGALNLAGLQQSVLSAGITVTDNVGIPTTLFTYSASSYKFAVIEYSIERDVNYRVGRIILAHDGAGPVVGFSDDYVENTATGIMLSADVDSGSVRIRFTSTATGFNGTLRYSMRRWS